jgi:hypothetical protein
LLLLQVQDAYHSFMYWLELAATSSEDLPWLDTLDFFWESLPGADKVWCLQDSWALCPHMGQN